MNKSLSRPAKSKMQLLLLLCAFVIPVILAKLLLTIDFKGEVKTHGGELLSLDKTYQQIIGDPVTSANMSERPQLWRVAYFSDQACRDSCETGLYHIQQTYKALGRLQDRVSLSLLNTSSLNAENLDKSIAFELFSYHQITQLLPASLNNKVVIIDPLGNFVMSYQFDGHKQDNLIKAHDMLLDIKQLLKLSRIG